MRWTPRAMILLGLFLLFWGFINVQMSIRAEVVSRSIVGAARSVGERMSEDEMRRVFDMPNGIQDRRVWFEYDCGLPAARGAQRDAGINALGSAGLGILMCAWGIAERVNRKRTGASPQ